VRGEDLLPADPGDVVVAGTIAILAFTHAASRAPEARQLPVEQRCDGVQRVAFVVLDGGDRTAGLGDKERQIGQQIQRLRAELGLSQQQLADRMKTLGEPYAKWRQSTIYKIEHGEKPLRVNELFDLATALGIGPEVLLSFDVSADVLDTQIYEMERDLREDEAKLAAAQKQLAEMDRLRSHTETGEREWAERVARRKGTLDVLRRLRANISAKDGG
jgi:transcriptional regulator with XRE-family HTH domain